jgi:hypothetical protein
MSMETQEPAETREPAESCTGCGLIVPGGNAGCQRLVDELWAREFEDVAFFRVHRMTVDTYCLQHPERYCGSPKSFAAHLTGLCWGLEHSEGRAVGSEALRRWLNGAVRLEKPEIPKERGRLTVADVRDVTEPEPYGRAVEAWARSTWEAYASLQDVARGWIQQALSSPSPGRLVR